MNNATRYLKILSPCRNQFEFTTDCLDNIIPEDHIARAIWEFVNTMDTGPCYDYINSFIGSDGRPTTSPKVLLSLWIYSIIDGNHSARKLEELVKYNDAYKWIAGGLSVNRTMLAEFISKDPHKFEDLLTNCLSVLLKAGLINDKDFAQDGTRIKANAGTNSFRTEGSLDELKEDVITYIKEIQFSDYDKKVKAKKLKIQEDRLKRVQEAKENLEKAKQTKIDNGEKNNSEPTDEQLKKTRASTTDPEVRKMKMGDGGFRLAYNVQLATGMQSRLIYGVEVINSLDPGSSSSMMSKVFSKLRKLGLSLPENWIADSAYSSKDDINAAAELFPETRYYAPPQGINKNYDPKKHTRKDTEAIKKWRDLIDTPEIVELYKERSSSAEFSNAQLKNRGFTKFSLRGLIKAQGEALLNALAQNFSRYYDLLKKEATI